MDQNKVNLWLHCIIVLKLLLSGYSNVYTELSRRAKREIFNHIAFNCDASPSWGRGGGFQLWCFTFQSGEGGKLLWEIVENKGAMMWIPLFGARISTVEKCLKQVQREQGVNYIEKDNWFHRHLSQEEICFLKINILNQKP